MHHHLNRFSAFLRIKRQTGNSTGKYAFYCKHRVKSSVSKPFEAFLTVEFAEWIRIHPLCENPLIFQAYYMKKLIEKSENTIVNSQ
jgi:hypothetical protein